MTNREWTLLISKEFNVSHTIAKGMLSSMMKTKKFLSVPKDIRLQRKECEREYERQLFLNEESDRADWEFMCGNNCQGRCM